MIGTSNFVQETGTQVTTGTFSLSGAVAGGYRTFATAITLGMAQPFVCTVLQTSSNSWMEGYASIVSGQLVFSVVTDNSSGTASPLSFSGTVNLYVAVPQTSLAFEGGLNLTGVTSLDNVAYENATDPSTVPDWSPLTATAQNEASAAGEALFIPGFANPSGAATARIYHYPGNPGSGAGQSNEYAISVPPSETVVIRGSGPAVSKLKIDDDANIGVLTIEPFVDSLHISGLTFDGNVQNQPSTPHFHNFRLQDASNYYMGNISSINSKGYGLGFENSTDEGDGGTYINGVLENIWIDFCYNDGIDFKNETHNNEGVFLSKWFVTNPNQQNDRDNAGIDLRVVGSVSSQIYIKFDSERPCDGFRWRPDLGEHGGAHKSVGLGILVNQNESYSSAASGAAVGFACDALDTELIGSITWDGSTTASYGGRIEADALDSQVSLSRALGAVTGWEAAGANSSYIGATAKNTVTGFLFSGTGTRAALCVSDTATNTFSVDAENVYLADITARNSSGKAVLISTAYTAVPYIRPLDFSGIAKGNIGSDRAAVWDWGSSPPSEAKTLTGSAAVGDNLLNHYENGQVIRCTSGSHNRVITVPTTGGADGSGREEEFIIMKADTGVGTITAAVNGGSTLSPSISTQGQCMRVRWAGDGSGWYVVLGY